jgi:hypothetical protein
MLPTKAKRLTIKTYSMMPNKEQKAHECDAREAASTTADDPQKSSQEEIEAESLVNNSRFGYPGDRYSERDFEAAKNLVLSGIEWALSRRGEEIESKAVGFAEWIWENCYARMNGRWLHKKHEKGYTTKELYHQYEEWLKKNR